MPKEFRTKLEKLLYDRKLLQKDLIEMIYQKTGKTIGPSVISNIVSGNVIDYYLRTAGIIAQVLGVKIDDIVEPEIMDQNYGADDSK